MKTITTFEELLETLENAEYNYYGLRGASEHDLEILDRGFLDRSQDNWNERDCEWHDGAEMLNGTSAIYVDEYMSATKLTRKYGMAAKYAANHHSTNTVLLIADNAMEWGDDEEEAVIGDGCGADVVAIVKIA